jgi:hypothetical protein
MSRVNNTGEQNERKRCLERAKLGTERERRFVSQDF